MPPGPLRCLCEEAAQSTLDLPACIGALGNAAETRSQVLIALFELFLEVIFLAGFLGINVMSERKA